MKGENTVITTELKPKPKLPVIANSKVNAKASEITNRIQEIRSHSDKVPLSIDQEFIVNKTEEKYMPDLLKAYANMPKKTPIAKRVQERTLQALDVIYDQLEEIENEQIDQLDDKLKVEETFIKSRFNHDSV